MSDAQTTAAPAPNPRPSLGHRLRTMVSDPNPILIKELRSIFRTKLFIRFLYLSTGLLGLVVLSGGGMVAAGDIPPADVGQIVFQIFFTIALAIISLVAPAHGSTGLTSEKEGRTYESLILTGMDPARIVTGKFLASYSSILLVLVAFAPIVGIAFLFGGISPVHVLVGFYGLMLALGPAVALGLAISARLSSTRISILLATMVFAPAAFFGTIFLGVIGEEAKRAWGTSMTGPFWFTEALSSRFFELDTFGLLGLLPLYFVVMTVWFLLAGAIAGVRPAAEDRSTPFKLWSFFSLFGTVVAIASIVGLFDSNDIDEAAVVFPVLGGFVLVFYAILFSNEPPLPPRLWEQRMRERGALGDLFRSFGPGAAPTTRFAVILIVLGAFAISAGAIIATHIKFPTLAEGFQVDVALLVLAGGNAAVAFFVATFGGFLRVVLRSGIAARVLSLATILALTIIPFLVSIILNPDALDDLDDTVPFLIRLSPVMPTINAVVIMDDGETWRFIEGLVPMVVYGLLGLFFWGLLEARVRGIRKVVDARVAARDAAVRVSMPPTDVATIDEALARISRPSARPPAVESADDPAGAAATEVAATAGAAAPPGDPTAVGAPPETDASGDDAGHEPPSA